MLIQPFKKNSLFVAVNSTLVDLPAPPNLSYLWNMGSILSACLAIQICSGILLASVYLASMELSFSCSTLLMEINDKGWLIRYLHSNGASMFFMGLYLHTGRNIYYSSYWMTHTWNVGMSMMIMVMATAFMGYVLPLNQMSFWGASVITNLFSEIPYIGPSVVVTVWGAMSVSDPTIMRFFTFHFLMPFVTLGMLVIHITLLHSSGSGNPTGLNSNADKILFNKYFSIKDLLGLSLALAMFFYVVLVSPLALGDNDNFVEANPMVTPIHIQPEWYFLFAYAILRSVPSKLGGVLALVSSLAVFYMLPLFHHSYMKSISFYCVNKALFWGFCINLVMLSWMGAKPVEAPFFMLSQLSTSMYFVYFFFDFLVKGVWDKVLFSRNYVV